ncbi:hypothetical protein [Burkholderia cenocepacia]|uniref:hypothetical protein n=1 Tax=Burkholderia cenocepacia TaxID=95486 RepID=UPI00209B5C7C|nr:hypothetical protein [Burkholderia cenocepacia]
MAVSILKIQVDRAEADQYFKDFKAFDDQLQGMPDAWKDALRNAKLLQAVQLSLQQGQKNQTSGLKDSNKQLTVMEKHWKNIGGTVKGINKDVKDVMSNVSKRRFHKDWSARRRVFQQIRQQPSLRNAP